MAITFSKWIKDLESTLVQDKSEILDELKKLDGKYFPSNEGNILEVDCCHLVRIGKEDICAHLMTQRGKLLLGKSRTDKQKVNPVVYLLTEKVLKGTREDYLSPINSKSNVKDCIILDKNNIVEFVKCMLKIYDYR